jgi:hypothetical protein
MFATLLMRIVLSAGDNQARGFAVKAGGSKINDLCIRCV